jgi:hypothetical protein
MTYSPSKPDRGPSPLLDVGQIRTNFSVFGTKFNVNHTAMNDVNQGDHESVVLVKQTSTPSVNQSLAALYCKDIKSKASTQPQLFARIQKFLPNKGDTNPAKNDPMQLTYNQVNVAGPVYQSFLPGGYLLYFGSVSGNTAPNVKIAQTVILSPAPTKILIANAVPNTMTSAGTPIPFSVSTTINTSTNDRFVINSLANGPSPIIPYSFMWMAIATA